jgi:hypothetical protein
VLGIGLHVGILVGLPVELDLIAFAIACLSLYPLFGRVTPAQERRMVGSA